MVFYEGFLESHHFLSLDKKNAQIVDAYLGIGLMWYFAIVAILAALDEALL